MAKIFYVMGKSASGKDTIYKRLLEILLRLKRVVLYTTRPIREGEAEEEEYHFTSVDMLMRLREAGNVVEERVYHTELGDWYYFTVDDGQIDMNRENHYLMIGTLDSYEKTRDYYGEDILIPIYVYVDDGKRLIRAIGREMKQKTPRYSELCRRYLADEEDFKEENLRRCGIEQSFVNDNFEECVKSILEFINKF